jgi:hypothetical protein
VAVRARLGVAGRNARTRDRAGSSAGARKRLALVRGDLLGDVARVVLKRSGWRANSAAQASEQKKSAVPEFSPGVTSLTDARS